MTTPYEARKLADDVRLVTNETVADALRSLADQVDKLEDMQEFYKVELDHAKDERDTWKEKYEAAREACLDQLGWDNFDEEVAARLAERGKK